MAEKAARERRRGDFKKGKGYKTRKYEKISNHISFKMGNYISSFMEQYFLPNVGIVIYFNQSHLLLSMMYDRVFVTKVCQVFLNCI